MGVGQDEVEIAGLAQVTVVVLVPGMGDDVQAIKAGIMEIADIFAINKADLPGADAPGARTARHAEHFAEHEHRPEAPPSCARLPTEGAGIAELLEALRGWF